MRLFSTYLCRYCKKYLQSRGCAYELKYEETGLCEGFEQKLVGVKMPKEKPYDKSTWLGEKE
jgi:hypothetical protein